MLRLAATVTSMSLSIAVSPLTFKFNLLSITCFGSMRMRGDGLLLLRSQGGRMIASFNFPSTSFLATAVTLDCSQRNKPDFSRFNLRSHPLFQSMPALNIRWYSTRVRHVSCIAG